MLQAYHYQKEESTIAMILVYEDKKKNWHLVKAIAQSSLSIAITSHCGEGEGGKSVSQVPDTFLGIICKSCRVIIENLTP